MRIEEEPKRSLWGYQGGASRPPGTFYKVVVKLPNYVATCRREWLGRCWGFSRCCWEGRKGLLGVRGQAMRSERDNNCNSTQMGNKQQGVAWPPAVIAG